MPRYAAKKDKCHNVISFALASAGCAVLDMSGLGRGAPDCLCIRGNITRLFEYKDKYGTLTTAQIKWRNQNPRLAAYHRIIRTREEAFHEMELS